MKWQTFLDHPKVVSDVKQYSIHSPGEYLYKKMLHDILECLNGYKSFMEVVPSVGPVPDDIQYWFREWNTSVEIWISNLGDLSNHCYQEKNLRDELEWSKLIANLASITSEVSSLYLESQRLTTPSGRPKDLIEKAIANIARLNLIRHYIQDQEYVHLWNTDY